jgi:hypothetical protein
MIRNMVWSIVVALLACSAASASDIRRVVTGLDDRDKAVVLFDSRLTLNAPAPRSPNVALWATDSSPPGFSFKADAALKPVGISPPDNGSAFRVVEFPPLDPAVEAKMDPNLLMKVIGDQAPWEMVGAAERDRTPRDPRGDHS